MSYAYYPGCSLHSSAREYDVSLRSVCSRLGIELEELANWTCCGSVASHAVSRLLAAALPVRNLVEAQKRGWGEVVVPCAGCYSRFKLALDGAEEDQALRNGVETVLEHAFPDEVRVLHPLELLGSGQVRQELATLPRARLAGLRVVCYYGCLLNRPSSITGCDDSEHPEGMDRLLETAGASVLDWACRTDCCGGSLTLSRTDIVHRLDWEILDEARGVGADAVVVACPLCHLNLDARQREIETERGTGRGLPILYFTQLLGHALGAPAAELGLDQHFVDPRPLLERTTPR